MKKALATLAAGIAAMSFAGQCLALDPQPEPPKEKPKATEASKKKVAPKAKLKKAAAKQATEKPAK